jgi:predicted phosphate transport protein (TIGR00153 family)
MPKFPFLPKSPGFFDLFERSAANLVIAAGKLLDLFEDYRDLEVKIGRIKELEHEGDAITHEIMRNLHSTFITPIDREDIALLCQRLDDVMDFIDGAARRTLLYRVSQPTQKAKDLAVIILKITYKVNEVLPLLRRSKNNKEILEQCVEINRLENEADEVLHSALADLFENNQNVLDVIKWREIYEHLESATDRGEDVANVLEAVVLKHA